MKHIVRSGREGRSLMAIDTLEGRLIHKIGCTTQFSELFEVSYDL